MSGYHFQNQAFVHPKAHLTCMLLISMESICPYGKRRSTSREVASVPSTFLLPPPSYLLMDIELTFFGVLCFPRYLLELRKGGKEAKAVQFAWSYGKLFPVTTCCNSVWRGTPTCTRQGTCPPEPGSLCLNEGRGALFSLPSPPPQSQVQISLVMAMRGTSSIVGD